MPAEGAKPEEEKAVTEEAAVVHMSFFEKFKELQVKLPSKTLY
jgi:hypothetical protein